jgi:hypothetical protein
MNTSAILLPMLAQIILTLMMFILLAVRKASALKTENIDRPKTALDNSAWNKEVVQVSNNIANQFQAPVLFYVLVLFFFVTASVSSTVFVLSWVFVVTRIFHAFIHVSSNRISLRLTSFLIGVVCLMLLTGIAIFNQLT